jgi:hypothetical protein
MSNGCGTFRSTWIPEDGCLWVHGVGEEGVPGFTAFGIECLQEIIAIERAAGRAPPKVRPPK